MCKCGERFWERENVYVCKNGVEQLLRINSVSGTSFWKRQDAFHTNW